MEIRKFQNKFLLIVLLLLSQLICAQVVTISKDAYQSTYDLSLLCPKQVQWNLYSTDLGKIQRERGWRFRNDIPSELAVGRHGDYSGTGYDRGHLCPSADRTSSLDLMKQTFSMSNICPQFPHVNQVTWYDTEVFCRKAAIQYDSVTIIVVPVFLQRDTAYIGKHRLAVPHAFFKATWLKENDSLLNCWFIWNSHEK